VTANTCATAIFAALLTAAIAAGATPALGQAAPCRGFHGPGGACYAGPGGGLNGGPKGGMNAGPGGGLYTGPGGGLYAGPGGGMYPGPGGGLSRGPGGGLYAGPGGGISTQGPARGKGGYQGPWSPCITGVLGWAWTSAHCPR